MRHVIELCDEGLYRPDIATLDCGSLNFGDGNRAYVSTPDYLRQGAGILRDLGVKAELEVFDTGNLWFVKQMIKEGLIPAPALIQLCTGIPYGVPADAGHLLAMVNYLPADCVWTSFAISRMQMPWVAQSILLGGNVRVGLEDNLYLSRGRLCEQRAAGREGAHHHRGHGRADPDSGAGPRAAEARSERRGCTIYRTPIAPEWIDYNGHLRDAYYGLIVSQATDALMDRLGTGCAPTARARAARCTRWRCTCTICTRSRARDTVEVWCASSAADRQAHPRRLRAELRRQPGSRRRRAR